MSKKRLINKKRLIKLVTHVILLIGAVIMLVPFIWMVLTSFKTNIEITTVPITFFPNEWYLGGYERVFERGIIRPFLNTVIVTVSIIALQLTTASMAAFAFARLDFPGKKWMFIVVISMMMVPQNLTLIPKYRIISSIGLNDTLMGVILPSFISISATFFLRQNFMSFPSDLEDAAKIDGCSYQRIFLTLVIPLSKGSLTAIGIMVMLFAYNDLLWPTIVISSEQNRLLSLFIASCKGEYVTDYGYLMAAASLAVLPMIVVYLIFQRYFLDSVVMSGIKG